MVGTGDNEAQRAPISDHQRVLVQASFAQVLPIADTAARLFYERLFVLDPSVRPLFRGDLEVQGRALMGMIRVAVNGLDRLEEIVGAVEDLGRRHATYGVQPAHYAVVGQPLLDTLKVGLGAAATDEVLAAWTAVYGVLASVMQRAAAEVRSHGHP